MNFIRKFLCFFLIFIVGFSVLNAQVAADPNDSFYEDALRWELQGIIPSLPEMRPYSLQLIKSVLETVMNSDSFEEASRAKGYYEKFFEKPLRFGFETSVYTVLSEGNFDKQLDINPVIYGNAEVLPNTTISFEAVPMLSTVRPRQDLIPKYTSPKYDSIADGVAPLGSLEFNIYTPFNAVTAFGTDEIYFQFGLNRNAFGPILDTGIVIGATAPHVGSMVFTVNKEKFNFQLALLMLTATNSYGKNIYPSKYFYFHSLRYSFSDKFDFTIFEVALTGPRFDFTYLMPIAPFMAMQQISGYSSDNLLLGAEFSYRPITGVRLFLTGLADDLSFNNLVKLNFDCRLKFALETGLQYVPISGSLCDFISADYTLVTPYTYTHSMFTDEKLDMTSPNYQNYTTRNVALGSMIEPNSDRFRFNISISPINNFKIGFNSSVVRHGNVNETVYKKALTGDKIEDKQAFDSVKQYLFVDGVTNGSIDDIPYAENNYLPYQLKHFMFLDETNNYICLQNSLDMSYQITFKNKNYLNLNFNYTLQYEKNVGVGNNMFTKAFDSSSEISQDDMILELNKQYEEWKSKLHNQISNFFSFSIKYVY